MLSEGEINYWDKMADTVLKVVITWASIRNMYYTMLLVIIIIMFISYYSTAYRTENKLCTSMYKYV